MWLQVSYRTIDYRRDIRPILSKNCFSCHGPDDAAREAGLHLGVRAIAIEELDSGETAIVPGEPEKSELVKRIRSQDDSLIMPPLAIAETVGEVRGRTR